jgi:hypothetical protein
MLFGNISDRQAACLVIMHMFIFFVVLVSMVCVTINKETIGGHFVLMDTFLTFLLLNSCVCALECIVTTPMYLVAADRRFRMRGAIAVGVVGAMAEGAGRAAADAREIPSNAREDEPPSDAQEEAPSHEACANTTASEAGSEGEKAMPGDSDSAASGANTHLIM